MIKPLLCISSPRRIVIVKNAYDKIDYVDKLWIKHFTEREALEEASRYFKTHTEYTHLIVSGDDGIPVYDIIAKLIADFEAYPEIEVISAIIGLNMLTNDNRLSVTLEPVVKEEVNLNIHEYDYRVLPYAFTSAQGLLRVWFQGFAFTTMTRHIFEKIGIRTFLNGTSECCSDVKFAFDCWKAGVPQYVDLRTFFWHMKVGGRDGEFEVINRGQLPKTTELVLTTKPIPKMEPAKILNEKDLDDFITLYHKMYQPSLFHDLPPRYSSQHPHPSRSK